MVRASFVLRAVLLALLAFLVLAPAGNTVLLWYVWASRPETAYLLQFPLDPAVPLPWALAPFRFLFELPGGYFAFYAWGRLWFIYAVVFFCTILTFAGLSVLKRMRLLSSESMLLATIGVLLVLGGAMLYFN